MHRRSDAHQPSHPVPAPAAKLRRERGKRGPGATPWLRGLALAAALVVPGGLRADYPIVSQRYLADPGALVHRGRVYLYCSNDDENAVEGGYVMKSIVCVSSSDLKNWTDHGVVFQVPANAAWAANAWAPAAIARNGRVYLYFGNNASGIGVASATTPTGPFVDAKGSSLVNSATPGATGPNMWLFDPAVFIDDDGQAYLYFGGNGITNARVIRLNSDMISTAGTAAAIATPNFFEASWIHKRNGTYYFSYSSNPGSGLTIDYMTSANPMTGFAYAGTLGFVLRGSGQRTVLIRGAGPALAEFKVPSPLPDPRLALYDADARLQLENDGWGLDDPAAIADAGNRVGAFPFPAGSRDAATVTTLPAAAYTVQINSPGNAPGGSVGGSVRSAVIAVAQPKRAGRQGGWSSPHIASRSVSSSASSRKGGCIR